MLSIWFGVMKSAALCTLMVGGATSRPADSSFSKCEEDHECSENMFCYEMRNCVPCSNCTSYFRKPHPWKTCAKEPTDCGDCLEGYKADILTNGEERSYCTRVEKASIMLESGTGPSVSLPIILVIGAVIVVAVAIAGVFLIHYWRKTRLRGDNQAVQDVQEPSHTGSGNGTSPLLGDGHERKTSIEERIPHDRPTAPPPPYESYVLPVGIESVPVQEQVAKCEAAVCFRDPGFPVRSFTPRDIDQESSDGSEADDPFHLGINNETGYPVALHDADTDDDGPFHPGINSETGYPVALHDGVTDDEWAEGDDAASEQSESVPQNAEAPPFHAILMNAVVPNDNNGTRDTCDSGLSQASSTVSLSLSGGSPVHDCERPDTERERLDCSCSSRSETIQGDEEDCESEQPATKRHRQSCEEDETTVATDAEDPSSLDVLHSFIVPEGFSEILQASDSGVSQTSSTASLSSNVDMSHCNGPIAKRQKLDSGNSSRSEGSQDDVSQNTREIQNQCSCNNCSKCTEYYKL